MMIKSWSILVLTAGAVIGYAVRPVPAVAQAEFQPFTIGGTVRLRIEAFPSSVVCKVTSISNDFIHCGGDSQQGPRAVNLRYVQEIAPAPDR